MLPFAWACGAAALPVPTQRLADAQSAERSATELGALDEKLLEGVEILRDLVEGSGIVRQLEKGAGIASGNAGRGGGSGRHSESLSIARWVRPVIP